MEIEQRKRAARRRRELLDVRLYLLSRRMMREMTRGEEIGGTVESMRLLLQAAVRMGGFDLKVRT